MSSTTSTTASRVSSHSKYFSPATDSSPNTSFLESDPSMDTDGFMQDYRRAGGPRLCSLPGRVAAAVSIEARRMFNDADLAFEVSAKVTQVLSDFGIKRPLRSLGLTGRVSLYNSEAIPIPTILVEFVHQEDKESSSKWRSAAKRIHHMFRSRIRDLSVELIDEKLLLPMQYHPLPHDHPIVSQWSTVCDRICQQAFPGQSIWNLGGITCWRYGAESTVQENPVTLIINVMEHAKGPFMTANQRVKGILAQCSIPQIDILFMDNELRLSPYSGGYDDDGLIKEACSEYLKPGVSIGIHRSSAGSSTLGGLVELRFPGSAEWQVFGLTDFHCVWPPPETRFEPSHGASKSAFDYWEDHPVYPKDRAAAQLLQIEHPASLDIRSKILSLQESLDTYAREAGLHQNVDSSEFMTPRKRNTVERYMKMLTEEREFFEGFSKKDLRLGYVFAGSGIHSLMPLLDAKAGHSNIESDQTGYRLLDWALIQIAPHRLPTRKEIGKLNLPFSYNSAAARTIPFDAPPSRPLSAIDKVYKSGRSSGFTAGRLNAVRDMWIARRRTKAGVLEPVCTYEHTVTTQGNMESFSRPGNSGSLIFTKLNEVLGMIVGGPKNYAYAIFTPISDIFKHIREITGAEEVRILIDED